MKFLDEFRKRQSEKPKKEPSKKARIISIIVIAVLVFGFMFYSNFENSTLTRTDVTLEFAKLPSEFTGYRIVQLSDLHGKLFGKYNIDLINMVKGTQPDIIAITGDIVGEGDAFTKEYVRRTVTQLVEIAPVYFIPGNNEIILSGYAVLKSELESYGAIVLDNRWTELKKDGASILLAGFDDPGRNKTAKTTFVEDRLALINDQLRIVPGTSPFKILLAHRPQFFEKYAAAGFDLILSGHLHGGVIRIPGVGGLIGSGFSLFPNYSAGSYNIGDTIMYVSRGIGDGSVPLRLNNRPEVVVITLHKPEEAPNP